MKVKFVPQNVEFEIKPGESVMHLAEDNGLYVKSVCRGVPSCAECRVRIVEGETNVFAPVAAELALVGSGWFIDRRRLACQLQCIGDVTVDMSEQLAKQQGLIGGRKAKAAKALGDRVEDETVIRESTGGSRSGGRSDDRSRSNDNEDDAVAEETPRNSRIIAPKPVTVGGPQSAAASTAPGAAAIITPSGAPGRIEPRPQSGAPGSTGPAQGDNRGGGGRSRRGRRR